MAEPVIKPVETVVDPAPQTQTGDEPPTPPVDAVALSALIASRLCHDLVNPVGALGSGLEVLEDQGMDDGMRDAAIDLIRTGGRKSVALLKYGRLAYGAAGGRGAEIPMEEAGAIMAELFTWTKADLEWALPDGHALKEVVKTVMIMTYCAADCVPRGGVVKVHVDGARYLVEAVGPRALLQDDLAAALVGDATDMKAKFAPAYVASLLTREAAGSAKAYRVDAEKVVLEAVFPSLAG
ncbi:MAG: histidine phosphotransferase family protein [Pseudomonadota bacterium]